MWSQFDLPFEDQKLQKTELARLKRKIARLEAAV
jgi:hypothetical protein